MYEWECDLVCIDYFEIFVYYNINLNNDSLERLFKNWI